MSAPIQALLSMRSTSQAFRNKLELKLLTQIFNDKMNGSTGGLDLVDFKYSYRDALFTRHLTEAEKRDVLRGVTESLIVQGVDQVVKVLAGDKGAGTAV